MPCSFGFNEEALQSIKRQLEFLELNLKRGSLVWDEMSLTKSVKFDSQKMKFEGFIDYGPDEIDDYRVDFSEQLADHAHVFIFRPYRGSWVQPIVVFATKGAAPGHIISRLITKAIVALEVCGARVNSITCDGAQPNKTAWADFGVDGSYGKDGKVACSMEHPTAAEKDERIWILQDVPHLFKCIRNHIFTRKRFGRKKVVAVRKSRSKKSIDGSVNPSSESARKRKSKATSANAKDPATESSELPETIYIDEIIQVFWCH